MKILGETKDGFIVELTTGEVANLTGYSSQYSSGFKKPGLGDEYNIETLIGRINDVERLRSTLLDLDNRLSTLKLHTKKGIMLFEKDVTETTKVQ